MNMLFHRPSWQLYWKKWHIGFHKEWDNEAQLHWNFLAIGPLQMNWWSS